ncbi:MAG: S4 domain-containing protein [Candidatus Zixiibacteriota bacterium]
MRLDLFLSKIGIIKRRTIAKEMADSGLIRINDNRAKPSREIAIGDIIRIGGSHPVILEVLQLPSGSIKREDREKYFKKLE